jgi:hypothetical protein
MWVLEENLSLTTTCDLQGGQSRTVEGGYPGDCLAPAQLGGLFRPACAFEPCLDVHLPGLRLRDYQENNLWG